MRDAYQPNTAVQPVTPAAPAKVPGKGGIWLGVLLIVAGIGGAIAILVAQHPAYEGTVKNLERAFPGYRTELVFEKTGTFTLYYKHAGEFTTLLDGSEQDISLAGPDTSPEFDVRLLDRTVRRCASARSAGCELRRERFQGHLLPPGLDRGQGRFTLEIVPDAASSSFAPPSARERCRSHLRCCPP